MSWLSLGQVAPVYDRWTAWPIADIDGELFRLTHSHAFEGVPGRLLLAPWYPVHAAYGDAILIYPNPKTQLIRLPVPAELRSQGIVLRDLECQITPGSKVNLQLDNWRIDLEVWNGPAPPTTGTGTTGTLDGGEY